MIVEHTSLSSDPDHVITAIRTAHRSRHGATDILASNGVRQLQGGLNNTVYMYHHEGEPICIKVYRVDDRHRAEREWQALQFLATDHPPVAPTPLWFDPDPEFPAVGMSFVPGTPLHHLPSISIPFNALADALHRLYAMTPQVRPYPYTRIGAVLECVQRIEAWAMQRAIAPDHMFVEYVQPLVHHWLRSTDRDTLRAPEQPVFARGDPNLANCLWDGMHLQFIDLEYAGWSDMAFELADLVEHINSRTILDEDWNAFIAQFIPAGSSVEQRFRAAQRTCALLWILLLWQRRDTHTPLFLSQVERVRRLEHTTV